MNKSEIADRVVGRTGFGRSAAWDTVDAVPEAISDVLARGKDVRIVGFATFGTRKRHPRTGRNPRTGESLNIAASTVPAVKAGSR